MASRKSKKSKRKFSLGKKEYGFFALFFLSIFLPVITLTLQKNEDSSFANAALSTSPSGEDIPVGDLPRWKQIFTDDFTTDVPIGGFSGCNTSDGTCTGLPADVKAKWWAYPDWWKDTSKNGTYMPSKVMSIGNGMMNLYLHTEDGVHMVAAPSPRIPGAIGPEGGLKYGRYAVRFRADPVHGYKTAWLLWPDSEQWPQDGEIDFPEGDLDGTISAFMHRQNGTSGGDQDAYSSTATYDTWHTAIIEWAPDHTLFIIDGQVIGDSTSRIPNTPMHWVIQTETALDNTVPGDAVTSNVQIDWVAVWAYAPDLQPTLTPTPTPTPTLTPTPTPTLTPTLTPIPTVTPTVVPTALPTMTPVPSSTQLLKNGSFENGFTSWNLKVQSPARASSSVTTDRVHGNYSAKVSVSKKSSNAWYVQLDQGGVPIIKGKTYTISFWAKGSSNRQLELLLQRDRKNWNWYGGRTFSINTAWRQYSYSFVAPVTDTTHLAFNLAKNTGSVWFDNIQMTSN